jgi:hypothetical protein
MNSKQVLDKIIAMLSITKKEEVNLTYAKLKDGTILESPTFDVGEPVEIVSEDGNKTPAPNGEHELILRDEEGKELIFKIITEEGLIKERENVELPSEEMGEETVKAEPMPGDVFPKEEKMAEETPLPSGDGVEEEAEPMPGEEGTPFDFKSVADKLSYRIEELEKKIAKMEDIKEIAEKEVEDMEDEEVLPKLDGAPIEDLQLSAMYKHKNKNKDENPKSSFLSKLYN